MTDPYGIIDLASLKQPTGGVGAQDQASGRHEVAVTEQGLEQIIADSQRVATLLLVTSSRVPEVAEFTETMRRLVDAKDGALRLATVDADAQPRVAGALRVQGLPSVLLLLHGQVQPMFEGPVAEAELGPVLDQVVDLARQQGLDVSGSGDGEQDDAAQAPLSPLQQKAYDAIESGDLDGALEAYDQLLSENPADDEAKAGRASVRLMKRTAGADLRAAREAAAERPEDLEAQLAVADLDVLGGHVQDAFDRLLELLRGADQEAKDVVRTRLLELFEVVGSQDERVGRARRRLANLLY